MKGYELDIYIEGYRKRERESWERTRLLAYYIAQTHSTKDIDIKKMMPFEWDEHKVEATPSAEAIDDLRRRAKEIAKKIG